MAKENSPIIVRNPEGAVRVTRLSSENALIESSLGIVGREIVRLNAKAANSGLTKDDALQFSIYVKALRELLDEKRLAEAEAPEKDASTEELLAFVKTQILKGETPK